MAVGGFQYTPAALQGPKVIAFNQEDSEKKQTGDAAQMLYSDTGGGPRACGCRKISLARSCSEGTLRRPKQNPMAKNHEL